MVDLLAENSDRSSKYVKDAFEYINILRESNNLEVLNKVKAGILEILYTAKGLDKNIVKNLLSEKLKSVFTMNFLIIINKLVLLQTQGLLFK